MSDVISGTLSILDGLLPGQIGSNRRWSTASVERLIVLADHAVRERTENLIHEQEIDLVEDVAEYTLDSEFVDVVSVEYSVDGSTYDYYLRPTTFSGLDCLNMSWRSDGGSRPEWYVLVGTPGTPTAKIHVYRPMSAVTAQTIRVRGHGVVPSGTDANAPSDVLRKCHAPYVMALLKAQESPQESAMWFGRYLGGVDQLSRRTVSPYSGGVLRIETGY